MGSVEDNSNAVRAREVIDALAFGPAECGISHAWFVNGEPQDGYLADCWAFGTPHQLCQAIPRMRQRAKAEQLSFELTSMSESGDAGPRWYPGKARQQMYWRLGWSSQYAAPLLRRHAELELDRSRYALAVAELVLQRLDVLPVNRYALIFRMRLQP